MINIKLIESVFSDEQKRQMIAKDSDAMVSVEGETLGPVAWGIIEEVRRGDLGIGGKPRTIEDA